MFFVPQLAATIISQAVLKFVFLVVSLLLAKVRARAPSKQEIKKPERKHKETSSLCVFFLARALAFYIAILYPYIVY